MSNLVDDAFAAVLHNVLSCQMVTLRRIGKTCLNFSYVAFLDTYFNKALLVNVGVAIRTPQTYTHTNTYIYIYICIVIFIPYSDHMTIRSGSEHQHPMPFGCQVWRGLDGTPDRNGVGEKG